MIPRNAPCKLCPRQQRRAVHLARVLLRERRARNPLYDLHVAARRIFWVAAVAGIIVFGSLMAAMFIGQQFLQEVLEYDTYSRYPGGRHLYSFEEMRRNHPEKLIEIAVKRMLPKSKMGRNILGKLKVYKGTEHPHQAQQPKALKA